jgi:hypothetical protein
LFSDAVACCGSCVARWCKKGLLLRSQDGLRHYVARYRRDWFNR